MKNNVKKLGIVFLFGILINSVGIAQVTAIGGFEGDLPSYWTKAEPAGATLEWATDQFRSMGRSLKISKSATSEAAEWVSENAADFWSPTHSADVDIKVGAYIRTEGVNTNPSTDDEKWYISYTWIDSAGVTMGETMLPVDQSVASSGGFVADTNGVAETILPRASWTTIMKFVGGKDATGTVWADDFMLFGRGGAWAGQNWNTSVGVPSGWIYWLPPIGGNDGELSKGYENTIVTDEESHSGLNSLKFDLPFDREPGDAFVGTKRIIMDASPGDKLRISVWLKASNLVPDSAAAYPVTWAAGFTYGFWEGNGNNDGWNSTGGPVDMQFVFPSVTSFDWTQYNLDVVVPDNPETRAISVRLHTYSRFTGTIYFDDLTVEKLDVPELTSEVGGFEGDLPSYWTKGVEPAGASLEWATDQFRSMGRSLKINKDSTAEAAVWVSENAADFWSPTHSADVDIKVGAYIRTEGVNTNPANDDEKWYISYSFYDSLWLFIGETMLPVDQSVASSGGFVADTNGVGETILPRDSWRTIMKFVGGKNATGTVWADDFMLYGRGGAWAGQNWNTSVGVPTGWIYWLPPIGGNDGELSKGYENTIVTDEEAYSGSNSLKFDLPFDREPGDAFVGTKRFLFGVGAGRSGPRDISTLSSVSPGDVLRISVWLKASNLVPDSAAAYPVTWAAGFTYGFWKGNGNNDGWNSTGGPVDMQFVFPSVTSFDWTQYNLDVVVPDDWETRAISVRLHTYSRFTGTIYFDDLTVEKLDVPELTSEVGGFEGDLPSYWTIGAEPAGASLEWATDQFRSMGRSLKISKEATSEAAEWLSENAADFWSPTHSADVDIKVGAYIRTEGVNTNPANDDEKWYISYTWIDSSGVTMGETMLPIDQSAASSTGFVADTNGIGATILPRASWTTIMKFVGGKDATGTVWADDFMLYGRGGAWAGQNWNTSVGVPTGWIYWLPPIGGNNGELSKGYENTIVTDEEAYSGSNSLKFDLPFDREPGDAFVGTKRFLFGTGTGRSESTDISGLAEVSPGDVLRISVWLKASNLVPDSAAAYPVTWAAGFTYGFWKGNGNNDGWNSTFGPVDMQFVFPSVTSFDWTQYNLDVVVPDDAETRAISVRLHTYSRFTGTIYFDDLTVEVIGPTVGVDGEILSGIPMTYELSNNYPNPFNPSTTIGYAIPHPGVVSINVYDILGHRIKTLLSKSMPAGYYEVKWDGKDQYGRSVSTGVYFYTLNTGNTRLVKRMLFIK